MKNTIVSKITSSCTGSKLRNHNMFINHDLFIGEAKTSGQPRLLLTAAVPASFEAIAAGYDVPEIAKYLDFINVMTYDFHGQWERTVGHNSPLFPLESASSYQKKLTVVSDIVKNEKYPSFLK